MIYTSEQRSAIFAFLATAMCCDGVADPREQRILAEAVNTFNITEYEQQHATDKTINQQAAVLSRMSSPQKYEFARYMKRIIEADGFIERRENFLFSKLMADIGVNTSIL